MNGGGDHAVSNRFSISYDLTWPAGARLESGQTTTGQTTTGQDRTVHDSHRTDRPTGFTTVPPFHAIHNKPRPTRGSFPNHTKKAGKNIKQRITLNSSENRSSARCRFAAQQIALCVEPTRAGRHFLFDTFQLVPPHQPIRTSERIFTVFHRLGNSQGTDHVLGLLRWQKKVASNPGRPRRADTLWRLGGRKSFLINFYQII